MICSEGIYVWISIVFLINTGCTSNLSYVESNTAPDESFITDDNEHLLTSLNYPQPYPSKSTTLVLRADYGYSVIIIVKELDLDSSSGDFLLIKPGTQLKDENKGMIFTNTIKNTRQLIIEKENVYIAFQVSGTNAPNKKGFALTYKRTGEKKMTTEAPTTGIPWPTPGETDHIYFTANVSGRSQNDFIDEKVLTEFKNALANMAAEYCSTNNIILTHNITIENIQIKNLIGCPHDWPDSEKCIKVTFSIPVFLENVTWGKYELSSENLEKMWTNLANKWLQTVKLYVYTEPDNKSNTLLWLLVSCITLLVFAIILLFIKYCTTKRILLKRNKKPDSDIPEKRESNDSRRKYSLDPHPLQITPPFFDKTESYLRFEPNTGLADTDGHSSSEDEVEISNFSNSRHNVYRNESIS